MKSYKQGARPAPRRPDLHDTTLLRGLYSADWCAIFSRISTLRGSPQIHLGVIGPPGQTSTPQDTSDIEVQVHQHGALVSYQHAILETDL